MRLFIDTNIIVEYIEHRQQYDSVRMILERILKGEHEGLVSDGNPDSIGFR
jgi:predicted nucleic acid-binding protein